MVINDFLQKLINSAEQKLNQEKLEKLKINDDKYRMFLNDLVNKKCPSCGKELELIKVSIKIENNTENVFYEFVCGHKHHEICISESINIGEWIKGRFREGEKTPHKIFLNRMEKGINPKSINGVSISWYKDKTNNIWSHIIKDVKTGKVLHYELMPLDKHHQKINK